MSERDGAGIGGPDGLYVPLGGFDDLTDDDVIDLHERVTEWGAQIDDAEVPTIQSLTFAAFALSLLNAERIDRGLLGGDT